MTIPFIPEKRENNEFKRNKKFVKSNIIPEKE